MKVIFNQYFPYPVHINKSMKFNAIFLKIFFNYILNNFSVF